MAELLNYNNIQKYYINKHTKNNNKIINHMNIVVY